MTKLAVKSITDWEQLQGVDLGTSGYKTITQEMINKFAEATGDRQWIHIDTARAQTDSPYKTTIAHGYLTLSLIPVLLEELVIPENAKITINYGIEELRFQEPVPSGGRVRLKALIHDIKNLKGTLRVKLKVEMEIAGKRKPAFTGVVVLLYQY